MAKAFVLHVLADACIELLDVEAAGLMLANPRGGLRLVASALGQSAAKRTLLAMKAAGSSQRIEPIDAAAIGLVGPAFPK